MHFTWDFKVSWNSDFVVVQICYHRCVIGSRSMLVVSGFQSKGHLTQFCLWPHCGCTYLVPITALWPKTSPALVWPAVRVWCNLTVGCSWCSTWHWSLCTKSLTGASASHSHFYQSSLGNRSMLSTVIGQLCVSLHCAMYKFPSTCAKESWCYHWSQA